MKLRAVVISVVGTLLPCLFAGAIVGIFFRASFWYWMLGIAALALFYVCLDRVPVRLFAGSTRGLSLGGLFKYGYTSIDNRPVPTDEEVEDRQRFNIYSYDHFYGDRDK